MLQLTKPPALLFIPLLCWSPFPYHELGEQNTLHISRVSESLTFRGVTRQFPTTLSGLHMPFKHKQIHTFPSAISACSALGQSSGGATHPSLCSPRTPLCCQTSTQTPQSTPEAGFQAAARTTPAELSYGLLAGKRILTYIQRSPRSTSLICVSLVFHHVLTFPSQLILFQ